MILGGFPDTMRVEIDNNIGVSAKKVGELRKLTTWPGNLKYDLYDGRRTQDNPVP
jgi:hypothetical protein